jgi:hypothetical protein
MQLQTWRWDSIAIVNCQLSTVNCPTDSEFDQPTVTIPPSGVDISCLLI